MGGVWLTGGISSLLYSLTFDVCKTVLKAFQSSGVKDAKTDNNVTLHHSPITQVDMLYEKCRHALCGM